MFYLLIGEVELVNVAHDGCIGPRVLGIQTISAIGEDEKVETLVKPLGGTVAMQHVLASLAPCLETLVV